MKYARQMGYEYIAVNPYTISQYRTINDEYEKNGGKRIKFYLINPYYTVISYRSAGDADPAVPAYIDTMERDASLSKSSNTVTATFTQPTMGSSGKIEIYNANDPDYNGIYTVTQQPSSTVFRFTVTSTQSSLLESSATAKLIMYYTQEQKDFLEQNMVWINTAKSFPYNLASSYYPDGDYPPSNRFRPQWDIQQSAVINNLVDKHMGIFSVIDGGKGDFAGYLFDEGSIKGEFQRLDSSGKRNMSSLYQLTGQTDSGLQHGSIAYEYSTYSKASLAFFKQLQNQAKNKYPDMKWGLEPYSLYRAGGMDATRYSSEWIEEVGNAAETDRTGVNPDMLMQEGSSVDFVDIFSNSLVKGLTDKLGITQDMVGTTQPNAIGEYENRLYAGKAGINGAWYHWFGRFGGTGNMTNFTEITKVYPRLKLIRVIPSWDNLNNIPLASRSWNGSVYQSRTSSGNLQSYINSDVLYSRHWKTGKLFAVFNSTNGVITLKAGETALSTQRVDGYFIEAGDGSADVNIVGNTIKLKSGFTVAVDTSNGQVMGNGYIFTLNATTSLAPVITSSLSSTGTIGTDFSYQITAANDPTSFNAAGLPSGLSVSTGGLISGTPTTIGTSSVTISAVNAGGTGVSTLTLSVYSVCDLNRDGATNVVDVQLQVNAALGVTACTSDINGDGSCNVIDVQRDVNASLGGQCVLGP